MFELTSVGLSSGEHQRIEQWFLGNTSISRNQITTRSYCSEQAISAGIAVLDAGESGIAEALQEVEGNHNVSVKQVPGRPFKVATLPKSDASKMKVTEPGVEPTRVQPGKPTRFTINASEAGKGDVHVKMEHKVDRGKDPKEDLQSQLRDREQQVTNVQRQLRGKELQQANLHKRLRERDQQLTHFRKQLREKELQEANLCEQLRQKDQQEENSRSRIREMEQQLIEKDEQEDNLQRQLRTMEQQLRNVQVHLREKLQESANLQQQVSTQDGQLRAKDRQLNEMETTLSTARQALSERQRQQTPDWVISRDQIQLTDKLLGRGGWGSVVEGKYCGCAVAVKQIHELILSPHNQSLFEREMDIASRCRHPCLLQFVGATNDEGSPLFVTELMESSLRSLLEQRPLSATEISKISLDVARALSYLHQKKPSPIIHRDISSANVLLWRQGDQWRGKVSDYGTANFMQHTMTVAPGAMIYIAPEALTSNQTVKVDVYSFGVLLCEMCIRELPNPERRDQQIVMVENRLLRALIRGCVQTEPEARPKMKEIIEELEKPV
ncbi:hypothetical protein ACROYT_G012385 [Oculina patagonica]